MLNVANQAFLTSRLNEQLYTLLMLVDQNHHGDREAAGHSNMQPTAFCVTLPPLNTRQQRQRRRHLKCGSAARKVNFSCPTVDWLPVERGIVGRQGAEALMLCGRWHRLDALPPGPMALLKITAPRLAAMRAFFFFIVCSSHVECVCVRAASLMLGRACECVCVFVCVNFLACVFVPSGQLPCQSLLSCLSHFSHSGELKRCVEAFHGRHAGECTHSHTHTQIRFLTYFKQRRWKIMQERFKTKDCMS